MTWPINPLPSQEYLSECFDYDPQTGTLTWRERPASHFPAVGRYKTWNAIYSGAAAGRIANNKYRYVSISNVRYLESRIIFKMMTGRDPREIDHIDRDPTNNRWKNLREADRSTNLANTSARINNKIGLKGVSRHGLHRYRAVIKINYQLIHLGTYDTPEEAHARYLDAARAHWKDFARG